MSVLDIILALPLLWAIYSGFKTGIIVQLGGIAGLLVGVYLAFRFGRHIGNLVGVEESLAGVVGFAIIIVVVIIAMAIAGRLLSGLFRLAGLGVLDRIGGAALSLVKVALLLGVLLYGFDTLNKSEGWAEEETLEKSILYKPLTGSVKYIFPYLDFVKDKLIAPEEGGEE